MASLLQGGLPPWDEDDDLRGNSAPSDSSPALAHFCMCVRGGEEVCGATRLVTVSVRVCPGVGMCVGAGGGAGGRLCGAPFQSRLQPHLPRPALHPTRKMCVASTRVNEDSLVRSGRHPYPLFWVHICSGESITMSPAPTQPRYHGHPGIARSAILLPSLITVSPPRTQ
jgi:hypothetical protein